MKKILRILLLSIGLSLLVSAFEIYPFPKNGNLTDVFNTNCLQMTQSQQMLKAYIMKGLNSNFGDPSKKLKEAIPAYNRRFIQIKKYFQARLKSSPKAIEAFNQAQKIWEDSKKILEAKPTKKGALRLKNNFNRMIPLLLQGSKPAAKGGLELLSTTGKLCRDPMKITIDYLLKLWGTSVPNYHKDIESIIKDFHSNLNKLSKNPLNNEHTRKLLDRAKKEFSFYEMMYKSQNHFIPNLLSHKADENFKIIREIKVEYKKELENKK